MKDLYTFDVDKEHAMRTYSEVSDIYEKLFKFVGVPFTKGKVVTIEIPSKFSK